MYYQEDESEQSLFYLIRRTSRAFRCRLNSRFADAGHDVTSEQWRILKCLWHKDGQRQQDLADFVHKDKTSITRIVDVMEKRDLVVRIPDAVDRRQKLIYLTNKGKRLQEVLVQIVQEISLEAQAGIEPENIEIFGNVLAKLRDNLSQP